MRPEDILRQAQELSTAAARKSANLGAMADAKGLQHDDLNLRSLQNIFGQAPSPHSNSVAAGTGDA